MSELRIYFLQRCKVNYQSTIDLFPRSVTIKAEDLHWTEFEHFVSRLHQREVFDGDIRQTLYRVIFTIDEMDLVEPAPTPHRATKPVAVKEHLVHCRCGSFFDETVLVQCYACQVSTEMTESEEDLSLGFSSGNMLRAFLCPISLLRTSASNVIQPVSPIRRLA